LLEDLKEDSASTRLTAPDASVTAAKPRAFSKALAAGLLVAAVLAAGAVWSWTSGGQRADPPGPHAAWKQTPLTSLPGEEQGPAFSPDGSQVAFSWRGETGNNGDIYVKVIGADKPLRLTTHPNPDLHPAWSPDGRWIAFTRFNYGDGQVVYYAIPPTCQRRCKNGSSALLMQPHGAGPIKAAGE
jgi:dipeptidyl aminopeptidase/acylaminoacyl peptidase